MSRVELNGEVLNTISGGSINYYPDTAGAETGRIGINGNYTHTYESEDDMLKFIRDHKNDKQWTSIAERDNYLFQGLIDAGIIK